MRGVVVWWVVFVVALEVPAACARTNHAMHASSFEAVGLPQNPHFFDVIGAMEIARSAPFESHRGAKGHTMDLEQEIELDRTNYELALHDSLFDYLISKPQNTLDNLDENARNVATRSFKERTMVKDDIRNMNLMCLPPLRIFGGALQMFSVYSRGKNWITPKDLQWAYKNSFGLTLSSSQSAAMIKGLQYNPRPENAPPTVTRCEFVKGYMEQRGYLDYHLLESIDTEFPKYNDWSFGALLQRMEAQSMPGSWRQYLQKLFYLDRLTPKIGLLTKCEIALIVASCRMHMTTHLFATTHQSYLTSKNEWAPPARAKREAYHSDLKWFNSYSLFPDKLAEQKSKSEKTESILLDLLVMHDVDGDYAISRSEFTHMAKTMDMWQDYAVMQLDKKYQSTISAQSDTKPKQAFIREIDIDVLDHPLLNSLAIRDEDFAARVSKIWDSVKDSKKRILSFGKMQEMMRKASPVDSTSASDYELAAKDLIRRTAQRASSGRDFAKGLSKKDFFRAILNAPSATPDYRFMQLRRFCGLMALVGNENLIREELHGEPTADTFTRDMYLVMMPIINVFEKLKPGPDYQKSGIHVEHFARLPSVLPRLRRAAAFRSAAATKRTFDGFSPRKSMDLPTFARIFTDDDVAPDGMEFCTIKSFVLVPRLGLPKDLRALTESDVLDQNKFDDKLKRGAEEVKTDKKEPAKTK